MPDFVATHRLNEEASLKMLQAGVVKANALGCKVSLAVVDASCRLIAFLMMDGARHFSIITTKRKAITAASQRLPTATRRRRTRSPCRCAWATSPTCRVDSRLRSTVRLSAPSPPAGEDRTGR